MIGNRISMTGIARAAVIWLLLCSAAIAGNVATYPAYDDSAAASTWTYGMLDGTGTSGLANYCSGTDSRWLYATMMLAAGDGTLLQPGTYYLTEFKGVVANCSDTHCDAVYLAIMEDNSGTLTPVTLSNGLAYVDMTSDKGADAVHVMTHAIASVSFTIESGKIYHLAWWLHGLAGRTTNYPSVNRMNANQGPQGNRYLGTVAGTAFPSSVVGTAATTSQIKMVVKFTTPVRTLFVTSYDGTPQKVIVPKRKTGSYWITCRGAVVADGEALTILHQYGNNATAGTRTTQVLDMGAADQQTFGGANVALAASGAEAGDTFELGVNYRPSTGKADLFYANLTTGQGPEGAADLATFSHACRAGAARGLDYTIATPSWLELSGTATVTEVGVGWDMVVLFGDSQVAIASHRLGEHLPTAFAYDRLYWDASISGNRLTTTSAGRQTAGYLRYKSTTPGEGDLCEMTGILFCYCGMGVNDLALLVHDNEEDRNGTVALIAEKVAWILDDLQDNANAALVIGLPPYSKDAGAGGADPEEAQAILHQLNPMLEGLSVAARCAYCNPWHALCQPGTDEADVPVFASAYTDDAGLHYNSAGAAIVAAAAARAYETGIVGGWWSSPWRRLARMRGSLWPL